MTRKEMIAWCNLQLKLGYEPVAISAIKKLVQELDHKEPPHPMHQQAVTHWKTFLKSHGIPMVMDARQGKILKQLLSALQNLTTSKTPEGALAAFAYLLEKYHLLNDWHQQNKTLNNLNKNLQEILAHIKNGTTKNTPHRHHTQQRAAERGAVAHLARRILLQNTTSDRNGRSTDGE